MWRNDVPEKDVNKKAQELVDLWQQKCQKDLPDMYLALSKLEEIDYRAQHDRYSRFEENYPNLFRAVTTRKTTSWDFIVSMNNEEHEAIEKLLAFVSLEQQTTSRNIPWSGNPMIISELEPAALAFIKVVFGSAPLTSLNQYLKILQEFPYPPNRQTQLNDIYRSLLALKVIQDPRVSSETHDHANSRAPLQQRI